MSSASSDDSDYGETARKTVRARPRKRIRRSHSEEASLNFPLEPLLSALGPQSKGTNNVSDDFEAVLKPHLPEFLEARHIAETEQTEVDEDGKAVRPLRPFEIVNYIEKLSLTENKSYVQSILLRKLKLERERHRTGLRNTKIEAPPGPVTPLSAPPPDLPVNPDVLDALYSFKTTPFFSSFLSRLQGTSWLFPNGLLGVDCETRTPWMNLMHDIHDHHRLSHPDRETPDDEIAPITYSTLHAEHVQQINELLEKSFWTGIDISDSLDYWPERSTVVAMYKKVVVGIAIISSPIETYITYLAVRAGWDKSQIARTILYYLIKMNPTRDFTLHVSTNSSAMLLYNQFGFKAEGFVADFYSAYLDPNSWTSKNAFMLRLRHV